MFKMFDPVMTIREAFAETSNLEIIDNDGGMVIFDGGWRELREALKTIEPDNYCFMIYAHNDSVVSGEMDVSSHGVNNIEFDHELQY